MSSTPHPRVTAGALATILATATLAHSPTLDGDLSDWCLAADSNSLAGDGRTENSGTVLVCGRCSNDSVACRMDSDCLGGQTCVDLGSRFETVWWDDRTDAAVNDLATLAATRDDESLYLAIQLWNSPDPQSLPFLEIAIDHHAGGIGAWHDPQDALTNAGHCNVDTDRGCTSDADCHFCTVSDEGPPSTRVRTCGSGCHPDIPEDVCDTSQVCVDLGSQGPLPAVGVDALPATLPDYLVVVDTGRWLVALEDAVQLMADVDGAWTPIAAFAIQIPPGPVGGPGGPFAAIELEIPWSAFGCTGCPGACACPDLGPGREFRMTAMIARATFTLDYSPDGAIEDVHSEAVAGATTTTGDSCPGSGIGTTACELADASQDAFVTVTGPPPPGGRTGELILGKGPAPEIELSWKPSCSAADIDYAVYSGAMGSFDDATPVPGSCSTGGATSWAFLPLTGDRYYLVVPTDQTIEGSYGQRSDGLERPASVAPCRPQLLAGCLD